MKTAIGLEDVTIYPVVEQQGPFFDAMEFFPTLTKELLEENRWWLPGDPLEMAARALYIVAELAGLVVLAPQRWF